MKSDVKKIVIAGLVNTSDDLSDIVYRLLHNFAHLDFLRFSIFAAKGVILKDVRLPEKFGQPQSMISVDDFIKRIKLVELEEGGVVNEISDGDLLLVYSADFYKDNEKSFKIKKIKTYWCDPVKTRQESSAQIQAAFDCLSGDHRKFLELSSRNKFKSLWGEIGTKYKESVILATGPSIEKFEEYPMAGKLCIACNSTILNKRLMDYAKPKILVFADPIFHFGVSRYASEFRLACKEILASNPSLYVIIPFKYYPLALALFPECADRVIGVPFVREHSINLRITPDDFFTSATANILTLLLFPLATTFTKSVDLIGCDGRSLADNSYFWGHGKSVQNHSQMANIQECHPGFFNIDYNEYYFEHCHTLDNFVSYAESEGWKIRHLGDTYIPVLQTRSLNNSIAKGSEEEGWSSSNVQYFWFGEGEKREEELVEKINYLFSRLGKKLGGWGDFSIFTKKHCMDDALAANQLLLHEDKYFILFAEYLKCLDKANFDGVLHVLIPVVDFSRVKQYIELQRELCSGRILFSVFLCFDPELKMDGVDQIRNYLFEMAAKSYVFRVFSSKPVVDKIYAKIGVKFHTLDLVFPSDKSCSVADCCNVFFKAISNEVMNQFSGVPMVIDSLPQMRKKGGGMQLVSINPDVVDNFGHYLSYERKMRLAARDIGVNYFLLGAVSASDQVYSDVPEFIPCFTGKTIGLFRRGASDALPDLTSFVDELSIGLNSLDECSSRVVFMYCGSLEIAKAIGGVAAAYPGTVFVISLYYLSWVDIENKDFVSEWLPVVDGLFSVGNLRLITPTEEMAEQLEALFGRKFDVLAHPSTTYFDNEMPELKFMSPGVKKVVFPGNLRHGKGFELTKAAVGELVKIVHSPTEVISVRPPPADSSTKAMRDFFSQYGAKLDIPKGVLEEQDFKYLIESASVIVLPYTPDRFSNRTSGLLIDALCAGVPCVVIEGTWLARVVDQYQFGIVVKPDGVSIAAGVAQLLNSLDLYRKKAFSARKEYFLANSWDSLVRALVKFNKNSAPQKYGSLSLMDRRGRGEKRKMLIIGNGPSAKLLAKYGFDKIPEDFDTFGTTCAYRYFERVNWWPTYYGLADRKVVFAHRDAFSRLINDPSVATERFFLSWEVCQSERLEVIPHSSTGSFCLRQAAAMGYEEIYLIGMEGAYVEELTESRSLSKQELDDLGFSVLNLTEAESKLRIITDTPSYNPNYFFSDYQQKGDIYSLPQAHTHQSNWGKVAKELGGVSIFNLSPISKILEFKTLPISEVFPFVDESEIDSLGDPVPYHRMLRLLTIRENGSISKNGDSKWNIAGSGKGRLTYVFDSIASIKDRAVACEITLRATSDLSLSVTLAREDGGAAYEGVSRRELLRADEVHVISIGCRFGRDYKRVKLQLDFENAGNKSELNVSGLQIESVIPKAPPLHDASRYFAYGNKLFRQGNYRGAIAVYLYLIGILPDFSQYNANAVEAFRMIGFVSPEVACGIHLK